jgi:hypothetical protein
MPNNLDPLNVNVRLYNQVSEILHELEHGPNITLKERVAALIAIGRIQVIFTTLRKEKLSDPGTGSSVRKYAAAFKANDARGRKKIAGTLALADESEPAIDDILGDDDDPDNPDRDDDDRDAAE